MKKESQLKRYQNSIVENGIAYIVYYAKDLHDIVHPLSVDGYEMLTDEFISFLEKYKVLVPKKLPLVLEIVGCSLTDTEKEVIENAIWTHFCLNMSVSEVQTKRVRKTCLIFFIFTILSSVLLLAVQGISDEILVNLAYVPFWFFGYRILIYLIIDCLPIIKKRNWYRRLAAMKLIFSEDGVPYCETLNSEKIFEENSKYEHEADAIVKNNQLATEILIDNGIFDLSCKVKSIEDLILIPELKGREYMSSLLSNYLAQAEPFISANRSISLEIQGPVFTSEEKERIKTAIFNYYGIRIASEEKDSIDNKQKILIFGAAVLFSVFILFSWGTKIDLAFHEFVIMLFYFFADYLLEFILISHFNIKKSRIILENCKKMNIKFKE